MRFARVLLAILLAAGLFGALRSNVASQDQEENTRGAFMTSRAKTPEKPARTSSTARPNRRRPKPSGATSGNTKPVNNENTASNTSGSKSETTDAGKSVPAASTRIGLGMTLFMRDPNGLAVRIDPAHEFHKGDAVRVLLETNADGHLYIFNTTDGGDPVMIYPDSQLDEAGNYLQAHVPVEIPSSLTTQERLRWFRFDEKAGSERLMFVLTREPLQGVPIEDELIKFCGENKVGCAWRPSTELWARLQKELNESPQVVKAMDSGAAQTPREREATTRGIGLSKDDPPPTLVLMSTSAGSAILVTALDLIHK